MSDTKVIKLAARNSAEENRQVLKECVEGNEEVLRLRENIKRNHKIDIFSEKDFPVMNRKFSWKKLREKCELREANASSSFAQLLRAGIQTMVNSMYQTVPVTFEDWAHTVQSSKDTELYAPLQGISFPSEIERQSSYTESQAAGLDIKLRNRKYGQVFSVEQELIEDDQTGEMQKQVALIAKYLKQVLEVLAYGKLASVTGMAYSNMSVPKSETQPTEESTYPWSTTLVGGGANRPASYTVMNQAGIQAGIIGLLKQKNKLGLKMGVQPTRLLIGPTYEFDASILLHSAYYPSGAAAAGNTGGAFAINPIKGILDKTMSRFMFANDGTVDGSSKAWYIVDDSVPWFVVQLREAASVVQENPASGQSFDRDILRFKGKTRANADHIDPRFAWQGSDGSV